MRIQIYAAKNVSKGTIANFRTNLERLGKVKEKVMKAPGKNGLAARLYVNNTPLRRYVLEPLTSVKFLGEIFDYLPDLVYPYSAGLFDAEGWVNFRGEVITMGWKDKPLAELIFEYLSRLNFEVMKELRCDGVCRINPYDKQNFQFFHRADAREGS